MSKSESKVNEVDSFSKITKDNTHKIINKLESDLPSKTQQFSELYTAYLHTMNNTFDSCIMYEKEFLEKLGVEQNTLKLFGNLVEFQTKTILEQMNMYTKFRENSTKIQLSAIRSFDEFIQNIIKANIKMYNQFNK